MSLAVTSITINYDDLVWTVVIVLLPLVPAVILYKLFEQKTFVTGPFKGLRLDLSGAFAGYFLILVVLCFVLYRPMQQRKDLQSKIENLSSQLQDARQATGWTVWGQIEFTDQPTNSLTKSGVRISIVPLPEIYNDGTFEVHVVKTTEGARQIFPSLEISKDNYWTETVHLESLGSTLGTQYSKNRDESNHTIWIQTHVKLRPTKTPSPGASPTP